MIWPFGTPLQDRVERQRAFFEDAQPGRFLVSINRWKFLPRLNRLFVSQLMQRPVETLCDDEVVDGIVAGYLDAFRAQLPDFYAIDCDRVPTFEVYFGVGAVTAAMCGRSARVASDTTWLDANLEYEECDQLVFDEDNVWVQLTLKINRSLWKRWNRDFHFLPYLHRSPLDAANGIRGNELFPDLYEEPERAKRLIQWCADWSISMERFLDAQVDKPEDWGRGAWDTWLPNDAILVNGDPVGLIGRKMQREFEGVYTERLFTTLGGGFFHHHAIGLHQVDLVARTGGMLVQQMGPDPKRLHPARAILENPLFRERILESSLTVPFRLDAVKPDWLPELLPILQDGRFFVDIALPDDDHAGMREAVEMVRRHGR